MPVIMTWQNRSTGGIPKARCLPPLILSHPLVHYNRYWDAQCGDKVRTTGGGDAQLLAGWKAKPDSRGGLITSCMGGRTIIQTFSNHDYHEDQIKDLWENYITYTLTNHFLAMP